MKKFTSDYINNHKYNIAIAGTGYVGLSLAVLLAQHNHVTAVDIVPEKVELINNRRSPIHDDYIEKYLSEKELDLTASTDAISAYKNADFIIIAASTDYDSSRNFFDCSAVEAVIELVLKVNPAATMIIKSTIPVGYTASVRKKYNTRNIIFSPAMRNPLKKHIPSLLFSSRARSRKISILFSWDSQKPKPLSCLQTHISLFVYLISTNSTPTQRQKD